MTASASVVEALRETLERIKEAGTHTETRRIGDAYSDNGWDEIEVISEEAKIATEALAALNTPHPAEQDAREAVDPIDERTGHPTSYSRPPLTQAAPDGWRLVPVEPDEAMLAAVRPLNGRRIWSAMISASPAPPAQGAG